MSKRSPVVLLHDILQAINKIERFTAGLSFDDFEENDQVVDAVIRNLEVIGEAVKHIPAEIRSRYDAVEWRRVAGFRDVAIHAYFEVDIHIIWTIITQQLPGFKAVVERMLDDLTYP
ncbi:MAG: DUF86 domain-containing protein [Anaerolineae bacterium]